MTCKHEAALHIAKHISAVQCISPVDHGHFDKNFMELYVLKFSLDL